MSLCLFRQQDGQPPWALVVDHMVLVVLIHPACVDADSVTCHEPSVCLDFQARAIALWHTDNNLAVLPDAGRPQATFAALGQPFEGAAAEAVSYLQEALALLPLVFCAYVLVRRYGPPLLDWLWRRRCTVFQGGEDARQDDTDAGGQEGRSKPHRRQAAADDDDEEEEERLLSDDGAEAGAEDEDKASMHHSNEDSPSLARLIELQVGRFSQYLDAPSL